MPNSQRQPENEFASFYQAQTSAARCCRKSHQAQTSPRALFPLHHFQAAFFRSQRQPCPFVQIFDLGIKGYA